ncbi:hypothetical protein BegalDRAFT_2671 [Beggiatoa alba B18LD]|uniref:DUF4276 domain-containing protein n=1 Tax=Beggiatoa alba B18LD TaxID=395493 RepID=I3CIR9_9GAMM|nr:DUF4276 family protein [Beggiatoa alba]EIJ43512.1 hypothetical protein BegalDRAFT_2671 [Beggiatoa alba B18LD]
MRGLYILGEGQTEEQFINEILQPYFANNNLYDVRCILMETSSGHKGGDVSYQRYKSNAEKLLNHQKDIIVTSLIDFFRLKTDFPKYQEAIKAHPNDKIQRVTFLENAIAENINHYRFIPYIQLHEFESLLFSSTDGFDFLPEIPDANRIELEKAVEKYENPELLNDGTETAPSKRLKNLVPSYQKTFHGPLLAEAISLNTILSRCERFKTWLDKLIIEMKRE